LVSLSFWPIHVPPPLQGHVTYLPLSKGSSDVKTKGKFVQEKGLYCTQVLFLRKAGLGFFHFLEIVRGWLVPSTGQKIPLQPGWYLPPQKKLPLAENRFLQAGKGSENTKEKKSRRCFMDLDCEKYVLPTH
jgi:hypothetical protein